MGGLRFNLLNDEIGNRERWVDDGCCVIFECFGKQVDCVSSGFAFTKCLCETVENVALLGTASQSSTNPGCAKYNLSCVASNAIDGNTDGDIHSNSLAFTDREDKPWWKVDLHNVYKIDNIIVWQRTDVQNNGEDSRDKLTDAELKIYRDSVVVHTRSFGDMSQSDKKKFYCSGILGDVVKIQLTDTNILILAEVQVFGEASSVRKTRKN